MQSTATKPDQPRTLHVTHDSRRITKAIALCAVLATSALAGCRENSRGTVGHESPAASPRAFADTEQSASGTGVTVTDRLNRRVTVDQPPQRIVSLTPSITEILFAIGAGDRIAGATQHCDYPPAATDIPRVGGGTLESINQETIVSIEPDLVLCKADTHEPLVRNLERLQIPVLALGPDTLAQLYEQTKLLGQITGHLPQAEALVESMQQRVRAVTEKIPAGDGPTVFYQVWDEPLMTAGPRTYIGEVMALAGGRSLFEETSSLYPKVSPEVVIAGDPEVILAPASHAAPVTVESILHRPGWSQVRAVREKRVYVIDRNHISRCGPRLVDALEEIAGVLYPDQFPPADSEPEATASDARKDRAP